MKPFKLTNREIISHFNGVKKFSSLKWECEILDPEIIDNTIAYYKEKGWLLVEFKMTGDNSCFFEIFRPWQGKFDPTVKINDEVVNAI